MTAEHDFTSALDKMERLAWSRNRAADREPRTITLTWSPAEGDDE